MIGKDVHNCLIVDTETSGLVPAQGELLEIAFILYSLDQMTTICQFSSLVPGVTNNAKNH